MVNCEVHPEELKLARQYEDTHVHVTTYVDVGGLTGEMFTSITDRKVLIQIAHQLANMSALMLSKLHGAEDQDQLKFHLSMESPDGSTSYTVVDDVLIVSSTVETPVDGCSKESDAK
jgi:hypothetical protein